MLSLLPSLLLTSLTLLSTASATALTYHLPPSEVSCFFTHVPEPNLKAAFYFAVQAGGNFEIDYTVSAPSGKVVLDGLKERQGDFVFTAGEKGEYRFCFSNESGGPGGVGGETRVVDTEISVRPSFFYHHLSIPPTLQQANANQIENDSPLSLPSKQGAPPEQTSLLSESVFKLSGHISTITRNQKYFRTRENRNFSTVRSTENRIWRFSIVENVVMVAMAGLQVFVVRFFFQGARKGYV
ncbi:MAG: hypothetical protein Q9162_007807 [Coniocarpon cinnabarinum]